MKKEWDSVRQPPLQKAEPTAQMPSFRQDKPTDRLLESWAAPSHRNPRKQELGNSAVIERGDAPTSKSTILDTQAQEKNKYRQYMNTKPKEQTPEPRSAQVQFDAVKYGSAIQKELSELRSNLGKVRTMQPAPQTPAPREQLQEQDYQHSFYQDHGRSQRRNDQEREYQDSRRNEKQGRKERPDPRSDFRDPRIDRMDSRAPDPRIDQRGDSRIDPRGDPRMDSRMDPRTDPRMDPRIDPRTDPRMDPRMDPRTDPRMDPRMEARMQQRIDPRMQPREPREPRLDPRGELNSEPRGEQRYNYKNESPRYQRNDYRQNQRDLRGETRGQFRGQYDHGQQRQYLPDPRIQKNYDTYEAYPKAQKFSRNRPSGPQLLLQSYAGGAEWQGRGQQPGQRKHFSYGQDGPSPSYDHGFDRHSVQNFQQGYLDYDEPAGDRIAASSHLYKYATPNAREFSSFDRRGDEVNRRLYSPQRGRQEQFGRRGMGSGLWREQAREIRVPMRTEWGRHFGGGQFQQPVLERGWQDRAGTRGVQGWPRFGRMRNMFSLDRF